MAPLLWRLPTIGIEIKSLGSAISVYSNRLFNRPSFKESLSAVEKTMEAES